MMFLKYTAVAFAFFFVISKFYKKHKICVLSCFAVVIKLMLFSVKILFLVSNLNKSNLSLIIFTAFFKNLIFMSINFWVKRIFATKIWMADTVILSTNCILRFESGFWNEVYSTFYIHKLYSIIVIISLDTKDRQL